MVKPVRVALAVATAVIAAACSSANETSAESTPENSAATAPAASDKTSEPNSTAATSTPIPTPTAEPDVASVEPRLLPPPDTAVRVTQVTTEVDGDTERIVFEVDGDTPPGLQARYVDVVTVEGEPVLVDGSAFLELMLIEADPNTDQGMSEDVAVELFPDQPLLREVRWARYLDGVVTYAVGLTDRASFRVVTEDDPTRVIVEFSPGA